MNTLVVSDLHLGVHSGGDVVRDPAQRAGLLAALPGVGRLVLLGDLLELRHGPVRDALAAARAALREIGSALDPGAEVVILAGNHDHDLLDPWAERRGRRDTPPALTLTEAPDLRRGEPLATVAGWLGAERVRIAYPGVWLRDDVFATHGHYLDVHLAVPSIERLATGVMRRVVALGPDGPTSVDDYEAILTPDLRVDPGAGRSHATRTRGSPAYRLDPGMGGPDRGAGGPAPAAGRGWLPGGHRRAESRRPGPAAPRALQPGADAGRAAGP